MLSHGKIALQSAFKRFALDWLLNKMCHIQKKKHGYGKALNKKNTTKEANKWISLCWCESGPPTTFPFDSIQIF